MANAEDKFLEELENRLEQNRKIAQKSWIPRPLHKAVSYLGFHSFRVLFLVSFGITALVFAFWYEVMVSLSKQIFLYL